MGFRLKYICLISKPVVHFSHIVIIILVNIEEPHRKEGTPLLKGQWFWATLQFSFSGSFSIHGEERVGGFSHF